MRAFLCVLDSFGVGSADNADPAEQGADTFGHIVEACAAGKADREGLRAGPLNIPNLTALGLGLAGEAARGAPLPLAHPQPAQGLYGFAREISFGKDTPSGHWEMTGLPVQFDWGYFPQTDSFPPQLIADLIREADLPGVLGNKAASGTEIIEELGEEHIRTGKPIVYTSADSVLQIAAHETHFGLERLYRTCEIARRLVDEHNVGRVIARPFVGERVGEFKRTTNRHDYAVPPHGDTLLDRAKTGGRDVIAVGKVPDIFAGRGVTHPVKAGDNPSVFAALMAGLKDNADGSLMVSNFNDFDTLFGHRRDVAGYAAALEQFDAWIPAIRAAMAPGDLMVFSADHGCDPTWAGTDHTREYVPVLAFGPGVEGGPLGRRETFADIGQTLAAHLQLPALAAGTAFL
jgi:phosphopentomutase